MSNNLNEKGPQTLLIQKDGFDFIFYFALNGASKKISDFSINRNCTKQKINVLLNYSDGGYVKAIRASEFELGFYRSSEVRKGIVPKKVDSSGIIKNIQSDYVGFTHQIEDDMYSKEELAVDEGKEYKYYDYNPEKEAFVSRKSGQNINQESLNAVSAQSDLTKLLIDIISSVTKQLNEKNKKNKIEDIQINLNDVDLSNLTKWFDEEEQSLKKQDLTYRDK